MFLDPFRSNIFIDSCAFDPKYEPESSSSEELFRLNENGEINLIVSHSNLKEIEHPNTPTYVKQAAILKIYSIDMNLTQQEQRIKENILDILTGNGNRDRMRQDATHVFESHKYRGYFVTADERILRKREELSTVCNAMIVKPSEMLSIIKKFRNS